MNCMSIVSSVWDFLRKKCVSREQVYNDAGLDLDQDLGA